MELAAARRRQHVVKVQKRFIDYAAEMGWQYTLVDSAWDRQIGYDGLKELVEYGRPKNVKILIWYNSAGEWNTTPLTPRDRMYDPATRRAEMQKIKELGIAGVKVDFFAGDAQSTIAYYHDILEDAARIGLAVNFHGATLPRGWQRTYPNLMTMEAVRGLEYNTFEQRNAEESATHDAMLPFARNVFDPMDFTPVVLDRLNNVVERRTSAAFELATAVLFTSGIQHLRGNSTRHGEGAAYVRDFLKHVPAVWDDVKFIDGFPGQYVVIARRAGQDLVRRRHQRRPAAAPQGEDRPEVAGCGEAGHAHHRRHRLPGFQERDLSAREARDFGGDHHAPARRVRAHVRINQAEISSEIAGFDM